MTTYPHTQPSVIIVGGGLAGLSAATYLARAGHAVMLFEKASTPGGRARTREQNGFFFNQGAHAFRLQGPGEQVLSELGVSYSSRSLPQPSGSSILADGKLHPLPAGAGFLLGTGFLAPAAEAELAHVFGLLKHMNFEKLQGKSLQDWLEEQVQHPQVRQLLLARVRISTYTDAPDLLSAGLAFSLLTRQVLYLDGGWQTLVDGLRQKAQEAGVRLITQARVKAIEVAGEGYRVRLADDSDYEASAVLLAIDPETAAALVADGTHETLLRWAAQSVPARVACLNIALRRLPRAENIAALCVDRPLYYAVHSATARLAPEGSALVHLMKYLRPGEAAEPEGSRQELEALMDLVQPGWRAEVVEQSFLPHMIASNAIIQARYGGLPGRPGPEVPERQVFTQFLQAWMNGNMEGLLQVLSDEIVLHADGGGKVRAAHHPLYRPDRVARYLLWLQQNILDVVKVALQPTLINGQPGLIGYLEEGQERGKKEGGKTPGAWHQRALGKGEAAFAIGLVCTDKEVQEIDIIINPEKLRHIPARNSDDTGIIVGGIPTHGVQWGDAPVHFAGSPEEPRVD